MNRDFKREMDKERRRDEGPEAGVAVPSGRRRARTGPRQFLREVRGELKRVAWPSRKEVASYSMVVLVAVTLLMIYVFALDQAFGQLVFWIFR